MDAHGPSQTEPRQGHRRDQEADGGAARLSAGGAGELVACLAARRAWGRLPFRYWRYRWLRAAYKAMQRAPEKRLACIPRADGLVMEVDRADVIDFTLYHFGVWEPVITAFIAAHLRPGDRAADFGANIGAHTLTMAHAVGAAGHVLAVEPGPETFQRLTGNLALNGLAQVEAHAVAAGAEEGVVQLFRAEDSTRGRASIAPEHAGHVEAVVPLKPAWSLWAEGQWRRCRLMKIDVERAEEQVLAGLAPIFSILPDTCAMLVEIAPEALARKGRSLADLVPELWRRGFRPYLIDSRHDLRFMLNPPPLKLRPYAEGAGAHMADIALLTPPVAAPYL